MRYENFQKKEMMRLTIVKFTANKRVTQISKLANDGVYT